MKEPEGMTPRERIKKAVDFKEVDVEFTLEKFREYADYLKEKLVVQ